MNIRLQSLRLALLIEASSFLVFFIPVSRTVTNVFAAWFTILNIPTLFLFRSHVWELHGSQMVFPFVMIPIFAIQPGVWFLVCYGLIWTLRKLKSKWRHSHDA